VTFNFQDLIASHPLFKMGETLERKETASGIDIRTRPIPTAVRFHYHMELMFAD